MNVLQKSAVFLASLLLPLSAGAVVPETYTMDNFFTTEHDRPVSFSVDSLGNMFGYTETGKFFSQVNIANSLQIRLQKFSIDEAYFYISDKGTIVASDDLSALSIYLTMA